MVDLDLVPYALIIACSLALGAICASKSLEERKRGSVRKMGLITKARMRLRRALSEESGQGTTEYAIIVGVLVVIAILAVTAFKGKIQDLWDQISTGIMGL